MEEIRRARSFHNKFNIRKIKQERQVISQTEYSEVLMREAYSSYLWDYYGNNIIRIIRELSDETWFIERYLDNTIELKSYTKPQTPYFILLKLKSNYETYNSIYSKIKKLNGVIELFCSISYSQIGFERTIYINVENPDFITSIITYLNEKKYITKELILPKNISFDDECVVLTSSDCKKIIRKLHLMSDYKNTIEELMNEYYEKTMSDVGAPEFGSIYFLISFLRYKFLYCTICSKQYDNYVDMICTCSNHDEKVIFNYRNIEIITMNWNLENLVDSSNDAIVRMNGKVINNEYYECNICGKLFESFSTIKKHLMEKHHEISNIIEINKQIIHNILERLDFFFLDLINGTVIKDPPYWIKQFKKKGLVEYSEDDLYIGSIKL